MTATSQRTGSASPWRTFAAAPLLFALLQLPEASADWVERALDVSIDDNPWLTLATVPYLILASALSSAATFAAVIQVRRTAGATFAGVRDTLAPKLGTLAWACGCSGLVICLTLALTGYFLGFAPIFVYTVAIYLFVPHLVIADERAPASVYLLRSRRLAHTALWKTLFATLVLLVAGLGLMVLQRWLQEVSDGLPAVARIFLTLLGASVSILVGAAVNIGVSGYFLALRGAIESAAPRET